MFTIGLLFVDYTSRGSSLRRADGWDTAEPRLQAIAAPSGSSSSSSGALAQCPCSPAPGRRELQAWRPVGTQGACFRRGSACLVLPFSLPFGAGGLGTGSGVAPRLQLSWKQCKDGARVPAPAPLDLGETSYLGASVLLTSVVSEVTPARSKRTA